MKKILFIINPIAGTSNKSQLDELIDEVLDKQLFSYDIKRTEHAGHASELTRQAVDEGVDIVCAVGGDGTVNEVASALTHTATALAIIPCGSGNGLARHLFIPLNARKSIEIINACQIHALDYGVINEHKFFCTCGMGFDAFVSMKFAEAGKRGPITYVQKILEEGLKYRPETYEITDDEGTVNEKAFLISCANASQYGNNAYIAPNASMSDGLMDVVIMEPFNLLDAPQVSYDLLNKTIDKSSKIKTFRSRHIKVHRSHPGVIHFDGDPVMTGEDIDIHIEPHGINIVVNNDADKSLRHPNAIQAAAAELFNQLSEIRSDIAHQTLRGIRLTKLLQKKLESRVRS